MDWGAISLIIFLAAIAFSFWKKTNLGILCLGLAVVVGHLAGMKDADRIAAVNTDRKAHIFDHADIGVTCDWLETAKALLMKLRAE